MTTGGQDAHQVQPPPQSDPEVAQVAQLLAAGLTASGLVAALVAFLAYRRIKRPAIVAALALSKYGTNHQSRVMGQAARRAMAREELYYRAAYLMNAARRIQRDLDLGFSLQDAAKHERRYWKMHEQARRIRLKAARAVDQAQELFGDELGWYLNPALNNDPECVAANGHNFDPFTPPAIGWPGTVHMGCGCTPGPPWDGAGTVDHATIRFIGHAHPAPRKLKLKRAG